MIGVYSEQAERMCGYSIYDDGFGRLHKVTAVYRDLEEIKQYKWPDAKIVTYTATNWRFGVGIQHLGGLSYMAMPMVARGDHAALELWQQQQAWKHHADGDFPFAQPIEASR